MARVYVSALLSKMAEQLREVTVLVQRHFATADVDALTFRTNAESWNIAECLEHLNAYGRFYIPTMRNAIAQATPEQKQPVTLFKPGWFGNYFTASMQMTSAKGVRRRMKTPRAYNPLNKVQNPKAVVPEFLKQQEQLLALVNEMAGVDIGSIRVPISLTKALKLKLGDTLRFNVAHISRHIAQAERVFTAYNNRTSS